MRDHRVFYDGVWSRDFVMDLAKRPRVNPPGENVYLRADGRIVSEEECIRACQRIWRERVYAPPGTLFEQRGRMYRKYRELMIDNGIRRRAVEEVSRYV